MTNEKPEEKRYRDTALKYLGGVFKGKVDDVIAGMLIGVQLQESDPAEAQRFFRMMLRGSHDTIRATVDQFAAGMRDW